MMRRIAYELTVKVVLLVGLVLSTVVLLRVAEHGITPDERAVPMFPGWFPSALATRNFATVFTAAMVPSMAVFWFAYARLRVEVRRMFPRERY